MTQPDIIQKKRGFNYLTKTKYKEFSEVLRISVAEYIPDEENVEALTKHILEQLCSIVKMDPSEPTYDKEKVERIRKETGKSTYDIFGRKYYEMHKEEMDKKNLAKTRERRERLKQANIAQKAS